MKKNKQGFTLIELLVVIAIIGLLSAFAVISLNSARKKSRDAKRLSDMNTLQTAMELLYSEQGSYTVSGCTGPAPVNVSTCPGAGTPAELEQFIKGIANLNDPSGETDACTTDCSAAPCNYAFTALPSGSTYTVTFCLEADAGNFTGPSATTTGAVTLDPTGMHQ